MHPAFSVIFFTVLSGTGYGLLGLMGALGAFGLLPADGWFAGSAFVIGLAGVTIGLLCSTLHLGHPERAWRAFSQWRSSWLSREGVAAVATYPAVLIFAYGWLMGPGSVPAWEIWGAVSAVMCAVTVYCTGQIYASLKTIPRWHNTWTVPNYILLGLHGGGLWLLAMLAVFGHTPGQGVFLAAAVLLAAWAAKTCYWRFIDTAPDTSTPETATGLGHLGKVRQLDAPHTEANYLLKEMGYRVARKHSHKFRRTVHILTFAIPLVALAAVTFLPVDGIFQALWLILAAVAAIIGLIAERWLFFAEAKHVVTLFYS